MILVPVQLVFIGKENLNYQNKGNSEGNENGNSDLFFPLLLDKFSRFESDNTDKFLFEFKGESGFDISFFEDHLHSQVNSCNLILSESPEIALIERCSHLIHKLEDKETSDLFDEKNKDVLDRIINNNGFCRVLCYDEFSNPDKYANIGWGDGKPTIMRKDNKVILYEF